ncbi:MAG: hypothetical protein CMJ89_10970 [Planctomycetes bacterium]|jgi:hypothetical protein|nr:hypothetical protein [Planctomycetota bacterium]
MYPSDFYSDHKYCETCCDYVSYLQSMEHSYCVQCGDAVRLFSKEDWEVFNATLKQRRPKGGRPKKKEQIAPEEGTDKESA